MTAVPLSWTDELVARLRELNEQEMTPKQIADDMGLTHLQVSKKLNRLQLKRHRETIWTLETIERLKALAKPRELSSTQIAAAMGLTPGQVQGKLERLGLPVGPPPRPKGFRPLQTERTKLSPIPVLPTPPKDVVIKNPPLNPVRLDFLPPGACKFPYTRDEEGEWLLCANRRENNETYCDEHHAVCNQPFVARRR